MYKGLFISFEGIDGTGKSTQIHRLAQALTERGYSTHQTKEPGDVNSGSIVGAGVRDMVFRYPSTKRMAPGVADILFLADHLQNAYDIRELLQKGKVVITDRYADSQFAYAESPSKKCPRWVLKVFSEHFGPVPDITVLMLVKGIEEGWALTRANARRGIEAGKQNGKAWNDLSAQTTIQEAYLSLLLTEARTLPIWVRQEDTEEELHQRILDGVMDRILQTQACKQPVLPMYAEVERIGMVQ